MTARWRISGDVVREVSIWLLRCQIHTKRKGVLIGFLVAQMWNLLKRVRNEDEVRFWMSPTSRKYQFNRRFLNELTPVETLLDRVGDKHYCFRDQSDQWNTVCLKCAEWMWRKWHIYVYYKRANLTCYPYLFKVRKWKRGYEGIDIQVQLTLATRGALVARHAAKHFLEHFKSLESARPDVWNTTRSSVWTAVMWNWWSPIYKEKLTCWFHSTSNITLVLP